MAGLLSRLLRRPPVAAPQAEQRALSSYYGSPGVGAFVGTATGAYVSPRMAENLCGITACINVIASAISALPPIVYRSEGRGRKELPGHPVARLLKSPHATMNWPDWIEWCMGSVLMHGNALAEIVFDGAGRATSLVPVPWFNVNPVLLPSGALAFDISTYPNRHRRVLADEAFYLKDRSDDGLIGRSRISRAPDVVGNASELQAFSAYSWQNQGSPSGAIEAPHPLGEPEIERLRANLQNRVEGTRNARRVLLLDSGIQWKSISISPEDAEVLESRRFTTEELARLFQVPPPLIADYTHNTFTNSQQAALWFAQFSLMPWIKKIEAEISRSVIVGSDVSVEIDMSSLVRGDYETRWKSYAIARSADILDVNEIREAEGYAPRGAA